MTGTTTPRITLDEERELVERLQRGDTAALEGLWRAYADGLYASVIFPRIPVREHAEEVLQNTFLKAWERIGGYTWQEHGIYPWLKTIARNLVMDLHRRDQRVERFCRGFAQHMEVTEEVHGASTRPDRLLADAQESAQVQERVQAVLSDARLNERYRQAIVLRLFEERDREECAQLMDVKVGTFDVLLHRALKRFQQLYQEQYGDYDAG